MARPTKNSISSGNQAWDGPMDDNDEVLFNGPIPIHEHTGDESDLASTFAANLYDRCSVMVDHSTLGWSRYVSDGTTWQRVEVIGATAVTALTDSSGGSANNTVAAVSGSGADSTINDNFADLAAKVNELRDILVDNGLAS